MPPGGLGHNPLPVVIDCNVPRSGGGPRPLLSRSGSPTDSPAFEALPIDHAWQLPESPSSPSANHPVVIRPLKQYLYQPQLSVLGVLERSRSRLRSALDILEDPGNEQEVAGATLHRAHSREERFREDVTNHTEPELVPRLRSTEQLDYLQRALALRIREVEPG